MGSDAGEDMGIKGARSDSRITGLRAAAADFEWAQHERVLSAVHFHLPFIGERADAAEEESAAPASTTDWASI